MAKCGLETEVFTRCVGYFRPTKLFNPGKKEEVRQRKPFNMVKAAASMAKMGPLPELPPKPAAE